MKIKRPSQMTSQFPKMKVLFCRKIRIKQKQRNKFKKKIRKLELKDIIDI